MSDEVQVLEARGVMVESLPDSEASVAEITAPLAGKYRRAGAGGLLAVSSRRLLSLLGLDGAALRKTTPLKFACRCSAGRAAAMVAALGPDEREALPPKLDVTCHMCGRTYTVATRAGGTPAV